MNDCLYRLKSCPRCGGDIYSDARAAEIVCLQCGYRPAPVPLLPLAPDRQFTHTGHAKREYVPTGRRRGRPLGAAKYS
jgi:transcription initiation factor TFIIIB Brf1 subunit/transcription initiation factor TFIIB